MNGNVVTMCPLNSPTLDFSRPPTQQGTSKQGAESDTQPLRVGWPVPSREGSGYWVTAVQGWRTHD